MTHRSRQEVCGEIEKKLGSEGAVKKTPSENIPTGTALSESLC